MTHREWIKAIQESYLEATGEAVSTVVAEIELERMCDAFVNAYAFEPEDTVRKSPDIAAYLANRWEGSESGTALRATIKRVTA